MVEQWAEAGEVYYSPISAWEVGLLGRPRRDGPRLRFDPDPSGWFDRFRAAPGVNEVQITTGIAMAAALLPANVHGDPADRLLIATARTLGLPLMTSDRRMIDYGVQGILDVIACRPEPDLTP